MIIRQYFNYSNHIFLSIMEKGIIGERIRTMREQKNMTIEALADRSGLNMNQINMIEDGTETYSLAPLIKIARVLGTRIGTFLDDQSSDEPIICRNGVSAIATRFSNEKQNTAKHLIYKSLSNSKSDSNMEPFIIDISPCEDVDFITSSHEGEDFILVRAGDIDIKYVERDYRRSKGDSIYYSFAVPHI